MIVRPVAKSRSSPSKITFPGFVQVIREAYRLRGIPPESFELFTNSISSATLKQYSSALSRWWYFCGTHGCDFYNSSHSDIIKFLTVEFNKGVSFSYLNVIRSAISFVRGNDFVNNLEVKRLFKGIFRSRPPRRKYDSIWDPNVILQHLQTLLPSEDLPLKDLSLKLVTLLALTTGHRIQTLSKIKLSNIVFLDKQIEIRIPDEIKTSGLNRVQPNLILPFFSDKKLCAAYTLKVYISRTRSLRNSADSLFISFNKPHCAIHSTQTLSRWIKIVLSDSGVDVSLFKSHSIRHASTSAAFRSGVNIDSIRKSAGWSKSSETFANFYNLPLCESNVFASSIINL
ncbi:uncharacterized protein LOC116171696 isoform X3 [Photinus pyralis]|uniref:uncharacterized protein LOC116171696 isoform X3 n=1 Tax=Photinus pyralis TaxID=7054 RepID=UPI0012670FD8|nr:uncharacterized protein LOC116171696 isoform X3 [Photinus pyralis]